MVNVILSLSVFLIGVFVTHGQSTAGDSSGCVYSFRVPTSHCTQTPSPSVDYQIWKSSVISLQAQVRQLTSDMRVLREHNNKLVSDVGNLQPKLATVTIGNRYFCSLVRTSNKPVQPTTLTCRPTSTELLELLA